MKSFYLKFLDLLLQFGDEGLFIFKLGSEGRDLLVFALDCLFEFFLVALKVGYCLLRQLQVTLNFSLGFFNITTAHT